MRLWSIILVSFGLLMALASPALAQDVDPAFMVEFQRNCMDEVDAYVGAYPPGVKARAAAINEVTGVGSGRATRAQLESGLADEYASLRRGVVPGAGYSTAYTKLLICSYTAALSVLGQRETAAQQQPRQAAAAPQRTQTTVPQNASYQAEWQRSCQPAVDEFEAAVREQNPQYQSVAPQMALLNDYRAGKIETANASRAQLEELRANAERRRAAPDATRQARAYGGMILCGYQVRDQMLRDQEQNAQRQPQGQQASDRARSDAQRASAGRNPRTALNTPPRAPAVPEKKKLTAETAHECLTLFTGPTDYGGFTNNCDFTVRYAYCTLNPNPKTDAKWADCAKRKTGDGLDGVKGHSGDGGGFTKSAKYVYWFACKDPAMPKAIEYRPGIGLWGSCG